MPHFHATHDLVLLFDKWRGTTLTDHLLFAAAVFVVSLLLEFLRAYMKYQAYLQATQTGRNGLMALAASFLYQINFTIGYGLMLIVMLYSFILLLAILLGAGLGYFIAEPMYGIATAYAKQNMDYSKDTKSKELALLKAEKLDTSFCSPDQFTYV